MKIVFLLIFLKIFNCMFDSTHKYERILEGGEKKRGPPTRKQLRDNQKCGCGDSKAPNWNYEPRNQVGYYKLLEQMLHFYTRYWAQDMVGKLVQAGDVNLIVDQIEIIQLTPEEQKMLKGINTQIFDKKIKKNPSDNDMIGVPDTPQFTTNNQDANVNKVVKQMAQLKASGSLNGNLEFKERLDQGLSEYVNFRNYCLEKYDKDENYKFNQCSKDHLGATLAHMSGYKVNLYFSGEATVQATFHVVYFLNATKKQSKFSFTYQPYFLQDFSQANWSKHEDVINKRIQQKFTIKQEFTIEEVYKKFTETPKVTDFTSFARKYTLKIKHDGFFYQPGRTEHRTACRLALGTLRLGIEMAFKIYYSPTITVHHCPPVHEHIFPKDDPDVPFFFKDPPLIKKDPPKRKPDVPTIKEKPKEQPKETPKEKPRETPREIPKEPPVKIEKQREKIVIDPPVEIVKKPPVNLYEIEIVASATVEVVDNILEMEVPPAVKQKLDFSCIDFEEQRKSNRFIGDIGFLLNVVYNTDNIFIECESEFRAVIKYAEKIKGYIDFIIDGEDYCTEIELIVLGQEVSGFECHSGSVENLDSLPEEADKLVFVAKLAYGPFIRNLYEVINKLSKVDSQSLSPNDFFLYFLADYQVEVDGIGPLQLISNKFSKLKARENPYYTEEVRNSIEGQIGNIDYFYFDQFPYAPVKISVSDSKKGFFKIRIDVGFQFLELYIPTTINYTEADLQDIKNIFANLRKQSEESQNAKNDGQEEIIVEMPFIEQNGVRISMEDVGKEEYRVLIKMKLKELYKDEFDVFFRQVLLSDTEGLFMEMANFEGFNAINYPGILQKYYTTDLISFQVLAATFNFIMLNFNNDRLPPPTGQKMSDMVSSFEQIMNITIEQATSQATLISAFWQDLDPQESSLTIQTEAHPYPNVFGLEFDAMWLYYLEGEEGSSLKNLARSFAIEKISKDMVMDLSQGEKLAWFDINFLQEKFLYNQNNYYSALFGNKAYNAKTIVRLWRYSYHPLKVIHVRLETMKFHTDHIIAESDYYDIVREFIKIIQEHTKHHQALMDNFKETAGSMKRVTYEILYNLIKEVFEEIKTNCSGGGEKQEPVCQGMRFPYKMCLSKHSYSPNKQDGNQILFYFEHQESTDIFQDGDVCGNEQSLKPAFKISEDGAYFNFQIFNARLSKMTKCKKTKENVSSGHKNYFNEYKFPIENCYSVELSFRRYFYNQILNFEFSKFSSIY